MKKKSLVMRLRNTLEKGDKEGFFIKNIFCFACFYIVLKKLFLNLSNNLNSKIDIKYHNESTTYCKIIITLHDSKMGERNESQKYTQTLKNMCSRKALHFKLT